uniref:Uncharacterized protein n=1 Tax=Meloidogyne enterolobii TaxID=390850 RepID=A0A6V7WSC0_MELEN|nr:unnamed protein product [Meloidogyne enterolobii]
MTESTKFEEDCMQSSPNAGFTSDDELAVFRARKVAIITGISGQWIIMGFLVELNQP